MIGATCSMTRDAIPTFELCSGESWRDPFGMYAALRDHDPVHHCARGDFYILTRFADVWAAAGDSATFSSARGLTVRYGDVEAAGMGDAVPMVFLDPPEHTAFRRLVNKGLSPRKVSTIEPDIRRFVVDRIERLREMGEADIVAELFNPLASFVVAHYLGVPDEDRALFGRWSEAIVQAVAGGDPTAAGDPFTELLTYFATLVRRRRTASRRRHRVRSGPDGRGHRLDRAHSRLRVHDGHRRQRHRHRHALGLVVPPHAAP